MSAQITPSGQNAADADVPVVAETGGSSPDQPAFRAHVKSARNKIGAVPQEGTVEGLTSQVFSRNVRLLKSRASRYAVYGTLIALSAIVLGTLLVARYQYGELSLDSVMRAQQENAALWLLDIMPFVFAFWGQYVSSIMAYEAGAMVVDQTSDLRAQTTALEYETIHGTTHDALTDLPNRVLLRDRVVQALMIAQRENTRLALLLMDLNEFKEVNNTLGHYNGDRLLKQVATRLQGVVREPATVARLGGDEFAILLPKIAGPESATDVARKVLRALEAPFTLEGLTLGIQASIGITLFPEHGNDVDALQQRADVAMYIAKRDKSGVVVYSPKLDQHSPQRLTLMGELRHAISNNELVLHYQPKIDTQNARITEVEALVRWQHPSHGLMKPDDFIPLAERTGLIKPLTLWVLNEGLRQCALWERNGIKLGICVNLAAPALLDPELCDTVAGMLAAHEVAPERLILEITESTIMSDPARALQMLTRLAGIGVRLSIDDFGTGYSSLSYLSKLPVSEIKIDKSFVMDMITNDKDAMIVRTTIDLGHNLGLKVVAEGVESEEILARLKTLGCDAAQGYYIGYPLSETNFASWVKQTGWSTS
ncbi:MAG: bifunctional diguanylate cyclase/phosphodiesterase [Gammaproteobacteria bacterium]|nr:bifunctional diguanylate cyclase/phosphodiesterase [Gammaproteobacteria bacterium]